MLSLYKNNLLKTPSFYFRSLTSSSLVRNISKVYSGDVLSKFIAVGTALLLIRGLTVSDYAAYTAFFVILTVIPGLVGSGINLSLVRFSAERISETGKRPWELYLIGLMFQFLLYSLFSIVLLIMVDRVTFLLFGQKDFGSSLRYGLIAGFGFLITQAARSMYQAEERFGHYVKTLWFRQISVFAIISLLFLFNQLNFRSAAKSIILVELSVGAIISFFIFKDFSFKQFDAIISKQFYIIKNFISSTGWLIAYFFILTTFERLDIFMLSHLSTEVELATYGVAFRYYSLGLLLLGSINAVLLPRFSKVDMQDSLKQRQFTLKWIKFVGWVIIPIIIADVFGKSLFVWITGVQYEKAFYIFVVFSIGIWLSLMLSPLVNILMSRKAFKFLFTLSVGALGLNFIGNYLLIPLWSGFGAAIATLVSHFLINGSATVYIFLRGR